MAPHGGESGGITALLGPTNTGKTHRAVERMLEHESGMIGLPLRLLAREVYDRVTARLGERAVALVTGEEKRIGQTARYWICTVEAMPMEREVDFLAVDEVQLAEHPQRGHVFTDRLLRARGRRETWLLGSDTMRSLVASLVPTATIRQHPRLSKLSASGVHRLAALPPRSAVIAFSAAEVYRIADRLRRRRGGAAVVLGALSPRTRNAQVAMYQAGEVDFLVATDAVGMGLNMDVGHVAFSALRKFDGVRMRTLLPAEVGQIAGRAGRYTQNGTFGTLAPLALESDTAFAVEQHRFAPVRQAWWRSSDLDLSSVDALLFSLGRAPTRSGLRLMQRAPDHAALLYLAQREDIRARARRPEQVALLWDVCRIPDFRKLLTEHHANLLGEIFRELCDSGRLSSAFMEEHLERLEDRSGDIDDLLMRMDFIRTWSYVAHHAAWLDDSAQWQERTRAAEDALSEALHERLIDRFVERTMRARPHRPSNRGRAAPGDPRPAVADGPFAALAALSLELRPSASPVHRELWAEEVAEAPHDCFTVSERGVIEFLGGEGELEQPERLARLTRGVDVIHPEVKLDSTRALAGGAQTLVLRRLRAFSRDFVDDALGPLRDRRLWQLGPAGRGLIYQLERGLGAIAVKQALAQLRELGDGDRELLAAAEITLGERHVFVRALLGRRAAQQRAALLSAWSGRAPAALPDGPATRVPASADAAQLLALGYATLGGLAIRVDVVEEIATLLAALQAPFHPPDELAQRLDASADDVERVLLALGYHKSAEGFLRPRRRRR
jgi:ATP-dependent RNA helicase SUPV3L1/SUV3